MLEKKPFHHALLPFVPLYDTTIIIHINIPVFIWCMEKIGRICRGRCQHWQRRWRQRPICQQRRHRWGSQCHRRQWSCVVGFIINVVIVIIIIIIITISRQRKKITILRILFCDLSWRRTNYVFGDDNVIWFALDYVGGANSVFVAMDGRSKSIWRGDVIGSTTWLVSDCGKRSEPGIEVGKFVISPLPSSAGLDSETTSKRWGVRRARFTVATSFRSILN